MSFHIHNDLKIEVVDVDVDDRVTVTYGAWYRVFNYINEQNFAFR